MRKILKIIYMAIVISVAFYVGGLLMFIKPIFDILSLLTQSAMLPYMQIIIAILKIFFSASVAGIIIYIGAVIYVLIFEWRGK